MTGQIYLVAYTDDDGPYAVAFSTRALAQAFVDSFPKRRQRECGMAILETTIDKHP